MKLNRLFNVSILCLIALRLSAQNVVLSGKINDKSSSEYLPGATIQLANTSYASITDIEGNYRIANIKPGSYQLIASYIGFKTQILELTLLSGEDKSVNIELDLDAISIGEVEISAQLLGQKKAINQQLNSDALVNIVSSDKMEELPDVNAAEAIGRLPGISVSRSGGEANKVTVRGLSPKLTNISVNGVKIAPTSNSVNSADRSVDLSTISSDLLSTIEVYKAPTADMDGDAIGGIVNLGVAKAGDREFLKVKLQGGYNAFVDQLSNYKGTLDYGKRFFDSKVGVLAQATYENVNRTSQSLSTSYDMDYADTEEQWPITNVKIQEDLRSIQRIGSSVTLDYEYATGDVVAQGFYNQKNGETETNYERINYGSDIRHYPRHSKSKLHTLQGILSGNQYLGPIKANWTLARSQTVNDNYYDVKLYLQERAGSDGSFNPKPYTTDDLIDSRTYNYNEGHLSSYVVEPEKSIQGNTTAALDFKYEYTAGSKIAGFIKVGAKASIDTRESDHDYMFNTAYYLKDQAYDEALQAWNNVYGNDLILNASNEISMENFYAAGASSSIWKDRYEIAPYIESSAVDKWHDAENSTLYENLAEDFRKYYLTERVYASYIMMKFNYSDWLTFIPGVRYEHSDNDYDAYISDVVQNTAGGTGLVESGSVNDTSTVLNYGVLLPSFHMKIQPVDWFDLRLSAVKTLARPDYTMIIPKMRVDTKVNSIWRGNPDLKHSEAWGYDATASFYSNTLGLFSVGVFYKQFDNYFTRVDGYDISGEQAQEWGLSDAGYYVEEDYQNFDGSEVYGFELDLQTNLSFLPYPYNGIVIGANMTRLWSKTFVPKYDVAKPERVGRETIYHYDTIGFMYESVLPDQVELAGNLMLGYDYKGFSCRLSMIAQSASLKSLGTQTLNIDKYKSYSADYVRFDASASQKIGDKLKITLNVANLTGASEVGYRYAPLYKTSENRYGMSFDLGAEYRF